MIIAFGILIGGFFIFIKEFIGFENVVLIYLTLILVLLYGAIDLIRKPNIDEPYY